MNHSEAVEQLAVERYLLEELAPDAREAFEEHLFDCQECALDLRAGSLFIDEAKVQLPGITDKARADAVAKPKQSSWLFWLRPMFAVPAFAALLGVVTFQNAVTVPALRQAANQPRLAALTELRPATRGADHQTLNADRAHGVAVSVDYPVDPGSASSTSYAVELRDSQGKTVWTASLPADGHSAQEDRKLTLFIPAAGLENAGYSLDITGLGAQGERISAEHYGFDIVLTN